MGIVRGRVGDREGAGVGTGAGIGRGRVGDR